MLWSQQLEPCSLCLPRTLSLLSNILQTILSPLYHPVPQSLGFLWGWPFLTGAVCAGFLGQNGSGKSSLLRILAGVDTSFDGERFKNDGINIAYLEQEPRLDSGRTVDDNIRPALARMQSVLDEYNQVRAADHVQQSLPSANIGLLTYA